jgi:hypothetical protein
MNSMGGEKMKRFFVPLVIVVLIFLLSGCIWGCNLYNLCTVLCTVSSGDEVTYVPEAAPPIPIVVTSNIGGGKVVAISSAYAFTGTLMGIVPGNTDLFRAVVDW